MHSRRRGIVGAEERGLTLTFGLGVGVGLGLAEGAPAGRSPLKMIWARRPSAMAMEKRSCARIWGGSCHRGGGGRGG